MKNFLMWVIAVTILVIWWSIAYYYWYSLPKIEREKLEYQKEQARKEEERLKQEKIEKEEQEVIKWQQYMSCINQAENTYNSNLEKYCNFSYSECKNNVDDYNRSFDGFPSLSHMKKTSYAECDKFIYKDWQCLLYDKYSEKREQEYKDALSKCSNILN